MVFLGKINNLNIIKHVDFGVYLNGENYGEILLPSRYVPEDSKIGDNISVFLYNDSEDRIIATTEKPSTEVGKFAYLKIVSVSPTGAFADWGLPKDLLVPYREQAVKMQEGNFYIVYTYLDNESGRIVASSKLNKYLDNTFPDYEIGQETDILITEKTDLGFKVIINNLHWGLLYNNEIFSALQIGEFRKGFIKNIREDDKIDVSLQKPGYSKVDESAEIILKLLHQNDGFLPYHDKSVAEDIYKIFGMSKKTFKMCIGNLYRKKSIEIKNNGIYLTNT